MNGPRSTGHRGTVRPVGQLPPLSINIPNSMSYRNVPLPKLSPTDDSTTPKKQSYYRPPGSPESPELPKAFFNYNHDRIQNDLLDEICDEIGIKDATDLDFMDFEPPGLDEDFNPDAVGEEIDNLDQLIMFGEIDPQNNQGPESGGPVVGRNAPYVKWEVDADQSVPESVSMPHNSPVYGNSPNKPHVTPDHMKKCYQGSGDPAQSPRRQTNPTWQQNNPMPGRQSPSNFGYDESHSSQAHMTDDYKIASPLKNSADSVHSGAVQGGQHHDSMLKMAIAQDRILGGRAGSPTADAASPCSQMPPSPGCQPHSPSATPGKLAAQLKNQQQAKVNQTDSSKGLDTFTAPENLPPGKERAMSRMKLVDAPGSGKRSPFDQGYFSVGSGGSHHEDNELNPVITPPHCPDQGLEAESDKVFEFLGGDLKTEPKPVVESSRIKTEQCNSQDLDSQCVGKEQNSGVGPQQRMPCMRPGDPPCSTNIAHREIHRAVPPRRSAAAKPGIFQRQISQNNHVSFEVPPIGSGGYAVPKVEPIQSAVPQQGYPRQNSTPGNAPAVSPAMAASANCAPYPRNCHPDEMSYGSKRSGSNPSSPKKQRRLTYASYQGDDNVVSVNNPGVRYNANMAGRPVNNAASQYGQQSINRNACQLGPNEPLNQMLPSSGQPRQMIGQHETTQGSLSNGSGQMVPGAHGAGAASMPMSSQCGYTQGHYNQQRHNQYSQGQGHLSHQGRYSHNQGQNHMLPNNGYQQHNTNSYQQPNSGYQQPYQQHQQHHHSHITQHPNSQITQHPNSQITQHPNSQITQHPNSQITQHPNNGYQQQPQQPPQHNMPYGASGAQTTNSHQGPLSPPAFTDSSSSQQQLSLGTLIANHPDAARYGFMQQLISDRTNAFRSHPLFPLLRDLIVADMNFSSRTFPFQLIANLPQDFDKLLSNYFQRNPPNTKYEANHAVENVVVDALRYAHKSLIEKISERKQKQGIVEQPKMFTAIEDFCERFDQAVKHTMTRSTTPKETTMHAPLEPTQQAVHAVAQQQLAPPLPVAPPPASGPLCPQPVAMSTPNQSMNTGAMPQPQYPPNNVAQSCPTNGPHGNMAPSGGMDAHQQAQLRSMSPYSMNEQNTAKMMARQSNYMQPSGGWGPNRSLGPPAGICSSLPSTPTKYGGIRGRGHYQTHSNSSSTTTINLSDVDLSPNPMSEQHKMGQYGRGSMPNFINNSGIGCQLPTTSPLPSPYKVGCGSPGPELQRAGSEPAMRMKYCGSPQREYGKDNQSNNNNTGNGHTNPTGSRKQVLPKEQSY